ncbi:MAG TPA: RNA polymerase sigma-70 factor [Prevotella sp.]
MENKNDFDTMYRLYYSKLFYFVRQYINNDDDCHDLVSSVFENVWKSFSTLRAETIKSYLYTNARNKCIDYLRHEKQRRKYAEFVGKMTLHYIEMQEYEMQEEKEKLIAQILAELKEPTGSILYACYMEQKKYKEVASEMNISVSTVKKHMVKALKLIREKWGKEKRNYKA